MIKSFYNAFRGVFKALKKERNLRFHLVFAFYVSLAAIVTGADAVERCVIALCIGTVIAAELLNSAIERLCDIINPLYSEKIGDIKDISAGAVLVVSIAAAVSGVVIFFKTDKLFAAAQFARSNIILTALIVFTIPLATYFIFRSYPPEITIIEKLPDERNKKSNDKKNSDDNNRRQTECGKINTNKRTDW